MYSFLLLIFLNQLITLAVFFHSFTINLQISSVFNWSKIYLLLLPTSFLDRFMSLVVGWFIKITLWSFKVTKELHVPFISILSNMSACFTCLIPSLLIFVPMLLFAFLQVVLMAFFQSCSYSICTYWMSSLRELASSLMSALFSYLHATSFENHSFFLRNFNSFTILTRLSSNWIKSIKSFQLYYILNYKYYNSFQ